MTLKKYNKNRGYSLSPYGEKKDTFVPLKIKWIEQIPEFKSFNSGSSSSDSLFVSSKTTDSDTTSDTGSDKDSATTSVKFVDETEYKRFKRSDTPELLRRDNDDLTTDSVKFFSE